MKVKFRNKLLVLALAGIMLAVLTMGTASATTWTYGIYNLKTTYSGGSTISMDSNQPSGNYSVATNDVVQWGNVFVNNVARSVTATASAFSGGLNYNEMSWTVNAQSTSPAKTFYTTVKDGTTSYTIHATHTYVDGGYYTSPECTSMQFY